MNAPRVRHVGARRGPLPKLSALVAAQATGELVCAAEDLEVHVFLQRGRVAWATSSAAPLVFARELCARAGIEPEAFREVVEGCRHDRRPLGETLVAWKLASAEDVRACLAEQIRQALASLHGRTNVNALFLERGNRFAEYDTALTFSLEEVRTEPQPIDDPDLLGQLRASVPESRWVVVRHGGAARASWPSELPVDIAPELDAQLFEGDVELVALRAGEQALVGLSIRDRVAWLDVEPAYRLGGVLVALAPWLSPPPRCGAIARMSEHGEAPAVVKEILHESLRRSSDVAIAHLDGPGDVGFALHREDLDPTAHLELQRRRAPALQKFVQTGDGEMGLDQRSMLLACAELWHFAAEVPDGSGRVLWLSIERGCSQGLAWALLAASVRELARVDA